MGVVALAVSFHRVFVTQSCAAVPHLQNVPKFRWIIRYGKLSCRKKGFFYCYILPCLHECKNVSMLSIVSVQDSESSRRGPAADRQTEGQESRRPVSELFWGSSCYQDGFVNTVWVGQAPRLTPVEVT